MGAFLRAAAEQHGDNEALVFDDQRLTYNELYRAASALSARLDPEPGQRIGVLMGNRPEAVITIFGITMAGAVVVPMSTFATKPEIEFVLHDAEITTVFTQPSLLGRDLAAEVRDLCDDVVVINDDCWHTLLSGGESAARALEPDDDAVIIYSSGTTANPKGVVHSHAAHVAAFTMQADVFGRDKSSRVWTAFPLFWTAGFDSAMGATLASGGCRSAGHQNALRRLHDRTYHSRPPVVTAFVRKPRAGNDAVAMGTGRKTPDLARRDRK